MEEDPKSGDFSLSFSSQLGILGETNTQKMEGSDKEGFGKRSEMSDSFVLDMEGLSHVSDKDLTPITRSTLQRNLSRKGSQRGEMKASEGETDASKDSKGGICTVERSVVVPVAIIGGEGRSSSTEIRLRRFNSINNRRSFWLEPRRVLLAFATLSSMGTLILIYFTLSIGNINGDDALAQ
ncbi:uncharacterized protein LOC143892949 isoform X2 [Tasmannia lanceolata]|uniref:uncharacterized protein LOC143892949 isoform X2 n=1 Tax=Tasmannia lanceolata TaxID=3420 RepID=UPI0040634EF4